MWIPPAVETMNGSLTQRHLPADRNILHGGGLSCHLFFRKSSRQGLFPASENKTHRKRQALILRIDVPDIPADRGRDKNGAPKQEQEQVRRQVPAPVILTHVL